MPDFICQKRGGRYRYVAFSYMLQLPHARYELLLCRRCYNEELDSYCKENNLPAEAIQTIYPTTMNKQTVGVPADLEDRLIALEKAVATLTERRNHLAAAVRADYLKDEHAGILLKLDQIHAHTQELVELWGNKKPDNPLDELPHRKPLGRFPTDWLDPEVNKHDEGTQRRD